MSTTRLATPANGWLDWSANDLDLLSARGGQVATFTRASIAWAADQSGVLVPYAVGSPRRHYVGGVATVLLEPARTNLCLQSDDFTNASWTKTTLTTAKTAIGPDGVVDSATTLTATGANSTALQAITSASAYRVTTMYVKRRTGTGTIQLTQNNGTNWTTVTVTSAWTRVATAVATAVANPTVGVRIVTSGDAIDVAFFQHEVGDGYSSPIRTTTASVTRSADALSFPFNRRQAATTLFVDGYDLGTALSTRYRILIGANGLTSPYAGLLNTGANTAQMIQGGAAGNVTSDAAASVAYGARVEHRGTMGADGVVISGISVNQGTEVIGATSAALAHTGAYSDTKVHVNGPTSAPGLFAFRRVILAPGTLSLSALRAMAGG